MGYWFTNPFLKVLLPMGNSTAIKGLTTIFSMPKLIMGANAFPEGKVLGMTAVDYFAAQCTRKQAFVVTDEIGKRFASRVVLAMEKAGFSTTIWDKAQAEAPLDNVYACGEAMLQFSPDIIVAVGGGSVIDGAKAAWIYYEKPDIGDLGMITPAQSLGLRKKAVFAAVPTTSGTGSECTSVTVVHDMEAHRKVPVANPELMPDFAVLCPEFTMSMPPKLTAGTGLDALSHAMDAIATPAANELTDAFALQAIQSVFQYLPRAYQNGKDREARHRMLIASSLAGIAFGQSGAALTHSFGHSLGSLFDIHHGLAVGIFIPYVFQFYQTVSDKYLCICKALGIEGKSREESLSNLVEKVRDLFRALDVPLNLSDLGISEKNLNEKLEKFVQYTYEDIDTLFSPRPITKAQCEKIIRYAHKGNDVNF